MGLGSDLVGCFVGAFVVAFVFAIAFGFAGFALIVRLRRGLEFDFVAVVEGCGSVMSRRSIDLASADFCEFDLIATFVGFAFCVSEVVFFGCGLVLAVNCDGVFVSEFGFAAGELVSLFETFSPDFGCESNFERLNLESVVLCFGIVSAGLRKRF